MCIAADGRPMDCRVSPRPRPTCSAREGAESGRCSVLVDHRKAPVLLHRQMDTLAGFQRLQPASARAPRDGPIAMVVAGQIGQTGPGQHTLDGVAVTVDVDVVRFGMDALQ